MVKMLLEVAEQGTGLVSYAIQKPIDGLDFVLQSSGDLLGILPHPRDILRNASHLEFGDEAQQAFALLRHIGGLDLDLVLCARVGYLVAHLRRLHNLLKGLGHGVNQLVDPARVVCAHVGRRLNPRAPRRRGRHFRRQAARPAARGRPSRSPGGPRVQAGSRGAGWHLVLAGASGTLRSPRTGSLANARRFCGCPAELSKVTFASLTLSVPG
mmetsp:Transcript_36298/g.88660  ORF Transcript_36298/g.88660 Transcript_36298/m.88660 type:complete len:212 (-) Transcript_36298:389-1024(-)